MKKLLAGIIFLAISLGAAPGFAQEPISHEEIYQTSKTILNMDDAPTPGAPKYFVAITRLISKVTADGRWVEYKYGDQHGNILGEERSDGITGVYSYGSDGQLQSISLSDGRVIIITTNPDGTVRGVSDGAGKEVLVEKLYADRNPFRTDAMNDLAIQDAITALERELPSANSDYEPVCVEGSPETCTVNAPGSGGGGGGGGGGVGGFPRFPGTSGNDRPGGPTSPGTGEPVTKDSWKQNRETCLAKVCYPGGALFVAECGRRVTGGNDKLLRCMESAKAWEQKCAASCVSGDWAWVGKSK